MCNVADLAPGNTTLQFNYLLVEKKVGFLPFQSTFFNTFFFTTHCDFGCSQDEVWNKTCWNNCQADLLILGHNFDFWDKCLTAGRGTHLLLRQRAMWASSGTLYRQKVGKYCWKVDKERLWHKDSLNSRLGSPRCALWPTLKGGPALQDCGGNTKVPAAMATGPLHAFSAPFKEDACCFRPVTLDVWCVSLKSSLQPPQYWNFTTFSSSMLRSARFPGSASHKHRS